jgi:hypothetical protein
MGKILNDFHAQAVRGYPKQVLGPLLSAGFKPRPGSEELVLSAEQLAQVELPDWILIEGQAACQTTVKGR